MFECGVNLDWQLSPLDVLARWPDDRRVMLLHSGRYDARWASRSIIAEPAGVYRFDALPFPVSQTFGRVPESLNTPELSHHPFKDLRRVLNQPADEGIWIGFISYDLGRWIERLPREAADDRGWPVIELGWCPGYLTCTGPGNRWQAHGTWRETGGPPLRDRPAKPGEFDAQHAASVFTPDEYRAAVRRVIDYIAAGDAFQVNLAQRFTAGFKGEFPHAHRALFQKLASVSPAWYGGYLELADATGTRPGIAGSRAIASTSPELFVEVNNRHVITRPIKGTRPASAPADELLHSEKDQAELNMIVDLLRNDLGRVSRFGSVKVTQPRVIESHPTVHHGVSTIEAELLPDNDIVDLLRASIPGGSITGAPKVRAMEIIEELEPVRRGPYCGAIGWLSRDQACLNIAIRTLLLSRDMSAGEGQHRVDFSVGGGIVADSDPQAEYQETLDKAAAMLAALGQSKPQ